MREKDERKGGGEDRERERTGRTTGRKREKTRRDSPQLCLYAEWEETNGARSQKITVQGRKEEEE